MSIQVVFVRSYFQGMRASIFMGLDGRGDTVLSTAVEPPIESGSLADRERCWPSQRTKALHQFQDCKPQCD